MNADRTDRERAALTRRGFLLGATAAGALVATGCGGDGASSSSGPSTTLAAPTTRHAATLAGDPFGLGIASGDPAADSVVLWTRLAPTPVASDARGGMPADRVDASWELAADDRFTKVVARGTATAEPDHGHSIHVVADGLEPGSEYWYRFTVGEWSSPVGRTRTLPDGSPSRFALAVANCQWREAGHYAAYRAMAEDDLDLVLHLGDYIYELAGNAGEDGSRPTLPTHYIDTLEDFRLRYASYKVDEHLQAAHARFPWVVTWDDHEVANNYMGDTMPGESDPELVRARKAAAYRAWWEHMPTRAEPPDGSDLVVHQALELGDLARLVVLDQRQDGDVPPCRDQGPSDFGDCDARTAEDRTRLGADQEAFVAESLGAGGVTWSLLGNPVVLAGIDAGPADGDAAYYLDTWDGYPQARTELIGRLAGAPNPVVLTGDYHAGMVLDVRATPFDQGSDLVCTEFMAPPISSPIFGQDVSPRTPQLRSQLNRYGYLGVEVTPDRLTAAFRVVADVADPASAVSTAETWTIDAGEPAARKA